MTLEQLRIFVAVAEREHLTRAAEALSLSPSAVSAAIKGLEERHGARLFDRVGRRIEMTATGRVFLPAAKATLTAAMAAETALSETTGLARGSLAIHASQTVAAYWLPELLMRFHATYPGVSLTLRLGNSETVAQAVIEGAADLGFIEGDLDTPALASRIVAADRMTILTAPGHPWADGARRYPSEIGEGRWILREKGSGTRSAFEASLMADGLEPAALEVVMTLPSNEAILTALMTGPYAGVASERVAENAVAAGRLARVEYELRPRAFRMLWHKERYRAPAARALADLLPRHLRQGAAARGRSGAVDRKAG